MNQAPEPRAVFARRLRALKDACDESVRDLARASRQTPRRRRGDPEVELKSSTIDGMMSRSRPVFPERPNFEVFVDTCLRQAALKHRPIPSVLADRRAWDAAYRATQDQIALNPSRTGRRRSTPAQRAGAGPVVAEPIDPVCPYPGLGAFGPQDEEFFCGRDELAGQLLDRVADLPGRAEPLLVIGQSGTGKSSLLGAALLPELARGGVGHALLQPGADPLAVLRAQLLPRADEQSPPPDDAASDIQAEAVEDFITEIRADLSGADLSGAEGFVVIVDQFEELFTTCRSEPLRAAFIEVLADLWGGRDRPAAATVVIGVRADFYGHCSRYPQLAEALPDALIITPMTGAQLRQAVEEPAALAGLVLQEGLTDLLLEDLGGAHDDLATVGALPLLSHALRETWEHRDHRALTLAGYRATGGITGALAKTANDVVKEIGAAHRLVVRRVLLSLVHLGSETPDTGRPLPLAELLSGSDADTIAPVLDRLVQSRLLTVDKNTVQIAHEALIRGWPQLRRWIEEDRAALLTMQQLRADARTWESAERNPDYLYPPARLESTHRAIDAGARLDELTAGFLAAADNAAEHLRRGLRRRRRTARAVIAALTVLTIVASTAGVLATRSMNRAERQHREIVSRLLTARSDQLRSTDPVLAGLLSAAAWRFSPTDEARFQMLAATANPAERVVSVGTDVQTGAALSPDGRTLVTGHAHGTLRFWDRLSGRSKGSALAGPGITSLGPVVFSPDGRTIAAGTSTDSGSSAIGLWDTITGRPLREPLAGFTTDLLTMYFSPDGRTMTGIDGRGVVLTWDTTTWHSSGRFTVGGTRCTHNECWKAVPSPHGHTLALAVNTGDFDNVQLWDPDRNQPIGRPLNHANNGTIGPVTFSPDGKTLLTGGEDEQGSGIIRIWDVATRTQKPTRIAVDSEPTAIRFTPDGRMFATGDESGAIRLWNASTLHQIGSPLLGHSGSISALAFGADNHTLVSTGDDGTTRLWDVSLWDQTKLWSAGIPPSGSAFGRNGEILAVASTTSRTRTTPSSSIQLFEGLTGRPIGTPISLSDLGEVRILTVSLDAHYALAVGSQPQFDKTPGQAGTLKVRAVLIDLTVHRLIGDLTGGDDSSNALFTPDNKTILGASGAWDVASRRQTRTPQKGNVDELLAIAPDGHSMVTTDSGGDVHLNTVYWRNPGDLRELGEPVRMKGTSPFHIGAISPDNLTLALGTPNGTISVWDVKTRKQIASISLPERRDSWPQTLTFTAQGNRILIANSDGNVYSWNVRLPSDPVRAACAFAGRELTKEEWARYAPGEQRIPICDR